MNISPENTFAQRDRAPGALAQCCPGQRTAYRQALEETGDGIADALPQKVSRGVRILAIGVGNVLAHACPLDQADEGNGDGGQQELWHERQSRQCKAGQRAADIVAVADEMDGVQTEQGDGHRGQQQRQNQRIGLQARPDQEENEGNGHHSGQQGRPLDLIQMKQQIRCTRQMAARFALVPSQVTQLAQDDGDGNACEEAGHHRVGDETSQAAQLEHAQQELEQSYQNGERHEY
jgi:hypothetical protein